MRRSGRVRILFLIDAIWLAGGAERFALALATHLPRDRFEVWLCATRTIEPGADAELERAGIQYLNLARRGKRDIHRFARLVGLLRRHRFDILHSHMFGSNVWGSILGWICRVDVVLAHEHNWSYTGNRLRMWLDRGLIARLATRFIAVSEANRRRMIELERIPADKILVLPTAYAPHQETAAASLRSELGLPASARLIVTVAILRPEKALEVLIGAHARLVGELPQAHLVIVGEGPCEPELRQAVDELGLQRSVHFLGLRRDVDSLLRQADVCAMSSDWEGMPLFALEAMAAGVPLVATSVGGIPEVVEDRATGLLVPPRDPAALSDALLEVLQNPELATRLADGAKAHCERFTITAVTARFVGVYEALLEDKRGVGAG